MSAMAFQNTGVSIIYSTVCSVADQRKHQSSALLGFVGGGGGGGGGAFTGGSPHKGAVTRKIFPFDNVIVCYGKLGHIRQVLSLWKIHERPHLSPPICASRSSWWNWFLFLLYMICDVQYYKLIIQTMNIFSEPELNTPHCNNLLGLLGLCKTLRG